MYLREKMTVEEVARRGAKWWSRYFSKKGSISGYTRAEQIGGRNEKGGFERELFVGSLMETLAAPARKLVADDSKIATIFEESLYQHLLAGVDTTSWDKKPLHLEGMLDRIERVGSARMSVGCDYHPGCFLDSAVDAVVDYYTKGKTGERKIRSSLSIKFCDLLPNKTMSWFYWNEDGHGGFFAGEGYRAPIAEVLADLSPRRTDADQIQDLLEKSGYVFDYMKDKNFYRNGVKKISIDIDNESIESFRARTGL